MSREKKFFVIYLSKGKGNWYLFWYMPGSNGFDYKRRKVLAGINAITDLNERYSYIQELKKRIVESGYTYGLKSELPKESILHKIVRSRNLRIRSEKTYFTCIQRFISFYKSTDLLAVKSEVVIKFQAYLQNAGYSNTTINSTLKDLHSIYAIAVKRRLIKQNPFKEFERLKERRQGFLPFNRQQMTQILSYLQQYDYDLFIYSIVTYYLMLRSDELRNIRVCNFDLEAKILQIDSSISKTSRVRQCRIPDELLPVLISYLNGKELGSYFVGNKNEPLKSNSIAARFNNIIYNSLGYSNRYSFYSWKHTGGKEYYLATHDLLGTMSQMGHSSPNTTWIYLSRIGIADLEGLKAHRLPISSTIQKSL